MAIDAYVFNVNFLGLHDPRRGSNGHRTRGYKYLWEQIASACLPAGIFNKADAVSNSEDELHPELRFTGAGILAMANSGPDTNGAFCLPQARL